MAIGRRLVPGLWWLTTGGAKTTRGSRALEADAVRARRRASRYSEVRMASTRCAVCRAAAPATATLLVSCRDRTGLVAALSEFVFTNGGNILDADQHAELETGLFFMRLVWDLARLQAGARRDRGGAASAGRALRSRAGS